jgi:flagellar assembly protein FliH
MSCADSKKRARSSSPAGAAAEATSSSDLSHDRRAELPPVIKSDTAALVTHDAIVLDLGDLRAQGQRMLEEARAKAEQIVAEGAAEAKRLTDAAADKGHAEGLERGLAEGREQGRAEAHAEALAEHREQFDALTASWTEAADQWERRRTSMLVQAKEDVLAFAFEAARKVVLRTIECDASVVADQVAEALTLLMRPTSVTIAVHPEDRATVEAALPQIVERLARCEHAALVGDPSIARGGCIVRTAGGEIDASIATQLDRIASTVLPEDHRSFETEADDVS